MILASFFSQPVVGSTSLVELLTIFSILGGIGALYRHVICNQEGCYRLGRFRHGHLKLCHVHHPAVPSDGKINSGHIDAVTSSLGQTGMLVQESHYLAHHGRPHPRVEERLDRGEPRTPHVSHTTKRTQEAIVSPTPTAIPSLWETIKTLLLTKVVPVAAAALTTWLFATAHVLNVFGITEGQVSAIVVQAATFLITYLGTLFGMHQAAKGVYSLRAVNARIERGN